MVLLKLTKSDLKAGKVVKPGRYRGKITEVQIKPAKTDGSTNYTVISVGTEGQAADVRFQDVYSEKYLGRFRPLLEALGTELPDDDDFPIDTDALVGREVGLDINNEMYKGQLRNRINGYFTL